MEQKINQSDGKKPYESPKLTTISLRPDEAVLGHCKISGTTGPTMNSCTTLFCSSIGS
jgi:hypothetical protein